MKRLFITLLLTAFCWTAFAFNLPGQDTTRKHQDTTKKQDPKKSKTSNKKKTQSKKWPVKHDNTNRKTADTIPGRSK